ncbi:hypothetical protein JTB14_013624 [Gonioctena quinquepunctata]|nr:hypothetical protein JTB14_013624 [Gonioctena quinquepunctata]
MRTTFLAGLDILLNLPSFLVYMKLEIEGPRELVRREVNDIALKKDDLCGNPREEEVEGEPPESLAHFTYAYKLEKGQAGAGIQLEVKKKASDPSSLPWSPKQNCTSS